MGGAGARLALLGRGRAELRGVPGWANLLTSNFPLKAKPCVSSSKPRAELLLLSLTSMFVCWARKELSHAPSSA